MPRAGAPQGMWRDACVQRAMRFFMWSAIRAIYFYTAIYFSIYHPIQSTHYNNNNYQNMFF